MKQQKHDGLLKRFLNWREEIIGYKPQMTNNERVAYCRALLERMPVRQGFWVRGESGEQYLACSDPEWSHVQTGRWIVRSMRSPPVSDFEGLKTWVTAADHPAWLLHFCLVGDWPFHLWSSGACWVGADMAVFQVGITDPTFIKVRVPPLPKDLPDKKGEVQHE
ncbi:MAG: hypothetical protein JST16_14940 [Bdellovibrionales bacterium]|nr:hypothetical protein [Bdellovibrionales bacterium]